MSKAFITESYLTGIANAIRSENGSTARYTPEQMAAAIRRMRVDILRQDELELMATSPKPGGSSIGPTYRMPFRCVSYFESDSVTLNGETNARYIRVGRNNNKNVQFFPVIPASRKKLYLDIAADATGQSYPISRLKLLSSIGITGYYDGNYSGTTLKNFILTNDTDPGEQEGLIITRTNARVVPRQIVEIDLSDINVDSYFTYFGCRSYFDMYEIYAE